MHSKYKKENYVHLENYWKRYIPKVLFEHYKSFFQGTIGDFGCNSGLFDIHFAEMEGVNEVVGFDINEEAIKKAKEFAASSPAVSKLKFYCQNLAEKIGYDNYFDFIICFHTLEHVYPIDIDECVQNIFTSLKSGGHTLINLPDKYSYSWEPTHVFHPNKEELSELFEKHGFSTVEAYEDERGGQTGQSRNITALYHKV